MSKKLFPGLCGKSFKRGLSFILAAAITLPLTVCNDSSNFVDSIKALDTSVMYGDVNSDGTINILDMIMLKSYLTEKNTTGFSIKAADLDDDGSISAKDAVELSMYLMNQIGSFSYEMKVDTDGDGLCDYIEKEVLGTDYKSVDTDGDGLNDYAEVYLCKTDPLKADTDNTGVKDSLKDADGDGLNNGEEIMSGTSPLSADTDEDGINDSDEVKKYKTNPLVADTDGDYISDSEELKLGLDPTKINTDGKTLDAERIFSQTLSSDSEIIKSINSDNNYVLSVSAEAAGSINEAIDISISKYSNYLQSDAVQGDIVDIDYSDKFKLENITVSFNISENPENYYIFKYFKDVNMLLPVETLYEGNTIYTKSTEDGTYCVININEWALQMNGNSSQVSSVSESLINNTGFSDPFEVYFMLYIIDDIDDTKKQVADASRLLIDYCNKKGMKINIYYVSAVGTLALSSETKKDHIDNQSSDEDIIDMLRYKSPTSTKPVVINTIKNEVLDIMKQNDKSKKFFYIVDNGYTPKYQIESSSGIEKDESITVSNILHKKYNVNEIGAFCSMISSNRKYYGSLADAYRVGTLDSNFPQTVSQWVIAQIKDSEQIIGYDYFSGAFYDLTLDAPITEEWYKAAKGEYTAEQIKSMGFPDSDGDGMYDFEEINWSFTEFKYGNIIFPDLETLCSFNAISNTGYIKLMQKYKFMGMDIDLSKTKFLLLNSNPMLNDSDNDGIVDTEDKNVVSSDCISIDDGLINDSNVFDKDYKKISQVSVNGNGVADSLSGDKPNTQIVYSRDFGQRKNASGIIKSISTYKIKPEKDSDYIITVDTDLDDLCSVRVYYYNFLRKQKPIKIESERNYGVSSIKHHENKFILNKNEEYTIEVVVTSKDGNNSDYSVKLEQDNWVYAPNGGIKTTTITALLDYDKIIYIPYEVMENTVTHISGFNTDFKIKDQYDLEYCIDKLKITQTKEKELRTKVGETATILGGLIAILPGGQIVTIIGGTVSVVGAATLLDEFDNNNLKITSINLDLIYNQSRHKIFKFDYALCENRELWTTHRYINKYYKRERAEINTNLDYLEIARACNWIE